MEKKMIVMNSKDNCEVGIHQSDVDNYQVEIVGSAGNKIAANLSEKQINTLAKAIARYNDLKI